MRYQGVIMAVITAPKLPSLKVGSRSCKGKSYFYLQTYTHHYDPKTKNSIRDSQKTVGKIVGGQKYGLIQWHDEFVEKYPELKKLRAYKTEKGIEFKPLEDEPSDTVGNLPKVEKKLAGAYWACSEALAQTGISDALHRVFGEYHRDLKLASIVMYMLIKRDGAVLHHYAPFSKIHYLPWLRELSDEQLGHLLSHVSYERLQQFFRALISGYYKNHQALYKYDAPKRLILALDSTSISTYSQALPEAEWGHNKDDDCLKQFNYLMLCDELTGMPLYGKLYKGNVLDVSTVKNLISDLELIFKDAEVKPELIFTTDRGYESSDNLQMFLRNGHDFIVRSKIDSAWVKDIVESVREQFDDDNLHDEFTKQFMVTTTVEYKYDPFPVNGKNRQNSASAKLYAHVYFDESVYNRRHDSLRFNVNSARERFNAEVRKLVKTKTNSPENLTKINIGVTQHFIDTYCKFDSEGFAIIDNDKVKQRLKYAGVMVILSNVADTAKLAYLAYSRRMTVERNFQNFKAALRFNREHVGLHNSLQGRFLCEFIASAIYVLFQTRLAEYEKSDAAKKDKLIITDMSLPRIIDELDTIMLTCYRNGGYFDEISGKYKTIYEALQIPLPQTVLEGIKDENLTDEDEDYEEEDPEMIIRGEEL